MPRLHRVTLAEVAKASGVASSTASMALNYSAQASRLTDATIRKVREAAARLGYRHGQPLQIPGRTLIGLFTLESRHALNEFGSPILRHLTDGCQSSGSDVVLIPMTGDHSDLCERIADERYAAFLFTSDIPPSLVEALQSAGKPVVMINLSLHPAMPWIRGAVGFDEVQVVNTALDHLASLGHRRIAYVSNAMIFGLSASAGLRKEAYLAWCSRHRQPPTCLIDDVIERTVHTMSAMPKRPTAILAYADDLALGVIRGCAEVGWAIPDDVSVMGINGMGLSELCTPPLSTVSLPLRAMAEAAIRLLQADQTELRDIRLPGILTPRQSTGPCR